jgi:hypothetical protein
MWRNTLVMLLERIARPLAEEGMGWAVIGSAATALQGVPIVPNDIDLLGRTSTSIFRIGELVRAWLPPVCAVPISDPGWHSSQAEPVYGGSGADDAEVWTFLRFSPAGVKVEAAHIRPPLTASDPAGAGGIREASPAIWPWVYPLAWQGFQVPVVPLEIQLETNLTRGLAGRVAGILDIFCTREYNKNLLRLALSSVTDPRIARLTDTLS